MYVCCRLPYVFVRVTPANYIEQLYLLTPVWFSVLRAHHITFDRNGNSDKLPETGERKEQKENPKGTA